MKTNIILLCLFISFNLSLKAQTYVTIPDANFATFLQQEYPGCMNGNQMDIDCGEIVNEDSLHVENLIISDLSGLEYFTNLVYLNCSSNVLSNLPNLPTSLISLSCYSNQLTSLPALPLNLLNLNCFSNLLTVLPILPGSLQNLECGDNQLTILPTLPNYLHYIDCHTNFLTSLPDLPENLNNLTCPGNQLAVLPPLPNYLFVLWCNDNNLTELPDLPPYLDRLLCSGNQLSFLPQLPSGLTVLSCWDNLLTYLPQLPGNLNELWCGNAGLFSLPVLPNSLLKLVCSNGQLTSLPELPNNLQTFSCSNNNISCFPIFPSTISYFSISDNPITCLPNYIPIMDAQTLAIPLCMENDFVNNPNGCFSSFGILGTAFEDPQDCIFDQTSIPLHNIPMNLFNTTDSLLGKTFSASNGIYQFPQETGTYVVKIDTLNMPLTVECQSLDTSIVLDALHILADSVNFALTCKPGFDIGTQSVLTNGWVFPGQNHEVNILAGDMSQWYNMACAAGISGEIQVSISGPVTYQNPVNGALAPSISGNVFTYTIADFGTVDFLHSFGLVFKTDTTAQAGDVICITINVTPDVGDNNVNNNQFQYCYSVINSYDPNMKEVYPGNIEPGYEDYFTYTIHFQNTGSAPAFNIRLVDTLDTDLDLETFQIINYSHYNTAMVNNNILTFHFPNIMLADSTTDLEGSKGFVQYRIKPKANLPLGTEIRNTANIYFDFNEPIVTNTTVNTFTYPNSLAEKENIGVKVYPNPFSSQTTIQFGETLVNAELMVYNVFGQKVKSISHINGNKLVLDRENLTNGIYFVKLISAKTESQTIKLIIKD